MIAFIARSIARLLNILGIPGDQIPTWSLTNLVVPAVEIIDVASVSVESLAVNYGAAASFLASAAVAGDQVVDLLLATGVRVNSAFRALTLFVLNASGTTRIAMNFGVDPVGYVAYPPIRLVLLKGETVQIQIGAGAVGDDGFYALQIIHRLAE